MQMISMSLPESTNDHGILIAISDAHSGSDIFCNGLPKPGKGGF
jgi:hypothetical protein